MFKLALLGQPQLELDGEPVDIRSRKGLALLCYLAAGQRAYSRSWLAGLFWAEKSEAQARRNLRVALTHLRRAVGDYVDADRTSVAFAWRRDHWLDIAQLRAALHQTPEAARAAAALVRGPFLQDLPVPDAPAFEIWLLGEREHYRTLARELLLSLLEHDLAAGQHAEGLEAARRLVALDPWQEDAQRWLIRFLALNGQQAAALSQFERCRQILAEELGVAPAAETVALAEAVRAGELRPAAPVPPAAPLRERPHNLPVPATSFVGRERELSQVRHLLGEESCRLLTLLGPGGVGKSRLALETAR
ncbi:MAG: BTAD domain-containing putative transcriptional regulator, partial [Candidatus Promineifilaceae bacterium]|nr:BTAD domain-containing putative transcriptional regulator [Candidatus Promineifilaceae bacterium]